MFQRKQRKKLLASPCRSPRAIDSRASRLTAMARVMEEQVGERVEDSRGSGSGGSEHNRGHARGRGGWHVPLHASRWKCACPGIFVLRFLTPSVIPPSLFNYRNFPTGFVLSSYLALSPPSVNYPMSMATNSRTINNNNNHIHTNRHTRARERLHRDFLYFLYYSIFKLRYFPSFSFVCY